MTIRTGINRVNNTGAPEHQSEDVPWQYVTYSVVFNLPPLATVYLKKIG